jgi:hypothetical protein
MFRYPDEKEVTVFLIPPRKFWDNNLKWDTTNSFEILSNSSFSQSFYCSMLYDIRRSKSSLNVRSINQSHSLCLVFQDIHPFWMTNLLIKIVTTFGQNRRTGPINRMQNNGQNASNLSTRTVAISSKLNKGTAEWHAPRDLPMALQPKSSPGHFFWGFLIAHN